MSLTDDKRIKAYLNGSMSTSEKLDFEYELKQKPALQEMVEAAKASEEESGGTMSNVLVGITLLSSILFLGFSAVYWHAQYNYTSNALLEQFQYEEFDFTEYDELALADTVRELDRQLVVMAHQYFKSNDYFEANDIFEDIIQQAEQNTSMFGESGTPFVVENAEWNRIIAYLTINNPDNDDLVNQYLQDIIANDDHEFNAQANKLMEYRMSFMHDLANAN